MALGFIGIILGLFLFLFLVYKGWSTFWVAPLCALLVAVFNQINLRTALLDQYIGGVGQLVISLFSIILAGTMFGKTLSDTGATTSIANVITNKLLAGKSGEAQIRLAILCVMIISGIKGRRHYISAVSSKIYEPGGKQLSQCADVGSHPGRPCLCDYSYSGLWNCCGENLYGKYPLCIPDDFGGVYYCCHHQF